MGFCRKFLFYTLLAVFFLAAKAYADEAPCSAILARIPVSDGREITTQIEGLIALVRRAQAVGKGGEISFQGYDQSLQNPVDGLDESLAASLHFKELRDPNGRKKFGVDKAIAGSHRRLISLLAWSRAGLAGFQFVEAELRTSSRAKLGRPGLKAFLPSGLVSALSVALLLKPGTESLGVLTAVAGATALAQSAYYRLRTPDVDVVHSLEFESEARRMGGHSMKGEWIHLGLSDAFLATARDPESLATQVLAGKANLDQAGAPGLWENSRIVKITRTELMAPLVQEYGLGRVFLDVFIEKISLTRMRLVLLISRP